MSGQIPLAHWSGRLLLLLAISPVTVGAQTVRGTVTSNLSPVRGAVVTLEREGTDSGLVSRSALTSAGGGYSILAPGPGRYTVVARRIGAIPHRSEPFRLDGGEVRVLNLTLDPATRQGSERVLSTVNITRATPCPASGALGARIATLWDGARTALLSSEIASRDRLVSHRVARYTREIDRPEMSIRSETITVFDAGDGEQSWFKSLPGDELSRDGYWQLTLPGVTEFYGPDANALLSEAFVRDHCFSLVDREVDGERLTGLAFAPIERRMRERSPPDIRGTIWLNADSAILRRVDFMWTKLTGDLRNIGGEVHFSRVADGPWSVTYWRLRMPQEVVFRSGEGTTRKTGLLEEGGVVLRDSIDLSTATATVEGVVRSSTGRPLVGAVVRVVGTHLRAVTTNDGRYALDSVPEGVQFFIADHDSLIPYGVRVGQRQMLIDEGSRRTLEFTAPTPGEIGLSLCAGRPGARTRAVLRVIAVDSTTDFPVAGARIRLSIRGAEASRAADISSAETDADGAVVFCDVVTEIPLLLAQSLASEEFVLRRGDIAVKTVRIVRK